MKKAKVWFNWHCPHCQHRNRVTFPFQFELPKNYNAEWTCDDCGELSRLDFSFTVSGWPSKKKPPKLKKRKQEKKKLKCKHDWINSTDHPGGEIYWKCKKCNKTKDFSEQDYKDEDINISETYRNDLRRRGLGIKK